MRLHKGGSTKEALVGRDRDSVGEHTGLLEVLLVSGPDRCLARFTGDLIDETRGILWGVEEVFLHAPRVTLDLSGITSYDERGLEAAFKLMNAARVFGGNVILGKEPSLPVSTVTAPTVCDSVLHSDRALCPPPALDLVATSDPNEVGGRAPSSGPHPVNGRRAGNV
jgi:hypothetical protein